MTEASAAVKPEEVAVVSEFEKYSAARSVNAGKLGWRLLLIGFVALPARVTALLARSDLSLTRVEISCVCPGFVLASIYLCILSGSRDVSDIYVSCVHSSCCFTACVYISAIELFRAQKDAAQAAMPPAQKQAAIFDDYVVSCFRIVAVP